MVDMMSRLRQFIERCLMRNVVRCCSDVERSCHNYRPPLHVHILYHASSKAAEELGMELVRRWLGQPATHGLRIPVFLHPSDGDGHPPERAQLHLEAARNLIIPLVERCMSRRVDGCKGKEWATFLLELMKGSSDSFFVLPVALDKKAFELDESLNERLFVTLAGDCLDDYVAQLSFFAAVRALYLLRDDSIPKVPASEVEAPVTLFLSHAKHDLDENARDPVRAIQAALKDLPVRDWFDSRDIKHGKRLDEEIQTGIRTSDAILVLLTDAWATRRWCREELHLAKEYSTPVVVVDALEDGEPRNFPYGGNTRTVRWKCAVRPSEKASADELFGWDRVASVEAHRVIAAGVSEAMRRAHTRRLLEGLSTNDQIVLHAPPEATDLAHNRAGTSFLYPDPPLDRSEQQLLRRLDPKGVFETPMSRVARNGIKGFPLAVSISSDSLYLPAKGLTSLHLRTLTDEVYLYMMLAGFRIVYGGFLDPDNLTDPDNFTVRLFDLARGYGTLAVEAGSESIEPILNVAPWPLWKRYNDDVYDVFGHIAKLNKHPFPDIGVSEETLPAGPNGFVPFDSAGSALPKYAWGCSLTSMRQYVTNETRARLCIGGRLSEFKGRMAGLIEEPLLSLRAKKPLFLIGAYGGCTELVLDLLQQKDREEMTSEWVTAQTSYYPEVQEEYARHDAECPTPEEIASELKQLGANGLAAVLNNGLDEAQNQELTTTTDPRRVAELVLLGCTALSQ